MCWVLILKISQNPESTAQRIVAIVGDELTMQEQDEVYRKVTGNHITGLPKSFGSFILLMNKHARGV